MNDVYNWIVESAGSEEIFVLATTFLSVLLFALGLMTLLLTRDPVQQRMKHAGRSIKKSIETGSLHFKESNSRIAKLVRPLRNALTPTEDDKSSPMRRRLMQAGFMHPRAAGTYYTIRVILALVLPNLLLIATPLFWGKLTPPQIVLLVGGTGAVGFYLPVIWVYQRIKQRQQEARESFPDALDMLLVCVEAGLALGEALNRVGAEIGRAHPILGEQFQLVALEMRAGKGRELALRNLADRIGIEEVSSLVTLLVQAESLGTSIAQSLRVHADDMRVRRLILAEENANKLPVKMAMPLAGLILPCLVLVIMTPVIIRLIRIVAPVLTGGAS